MSDFLMYERNGEVLLDPFGTFLALFIVLLVGIGISRMRIPQTLKTVLYAGLLFRVMGAAGRYIVLFGVYNGSGDARDYYSGGLANSVFFWNFDFRSIFDPVNWVKDNWWGTQFVYFPSTLVQSILGPSMPGGFVLFSLFSFLGICGFVIAFRRTYPHVPTHRYAMWVFLFPALWFWPSSIGKEALLLCGLGLTIWGYIGVRGRINWLLLGFGMFIVFGVRPEVSAVLAACLLFAHWLSLITGRWTVGNTVQAIILIAVAIGGMYLSLSIMGVRQMDLAGVTDYIENEAGRRLGGGSSFDAPPIGPIGIPIALVNILFRPFPWEANGLMPLITSMEVIALWVLLWYRRRNVKLALRWWRHDPLLRIAIPFIFLYSVSLGMVIANMGVVARQRIFLFPFLFLLLEAVPKRALARKPRPRGPMLPVREREPHRVGPRVPEPAFRRT